MPWAGTLALCITISFAAGHFVLYFASISYVLDVYYERIPLQ